MTGGMLIKRGVSLTELNEIWRIIFSSWYMFHPFLERNRAKGRALASDTHQASGRLTGPYMHTTQVA